VRGEVDVDLHEGVRGRHASIEVLVARGLRFDLGHPEAGQGRVARSFASEELPVSDRRLAAPPLHP